MWGYVRKRARREKHCPQYRVSGLFRKRDPTWLAMRVSREPISTAFTQLSPYFMTRIWTRGVATDVMFNAITGVYFKLVIGLALLGSLYKFI